MDSSCVKLPNPVPRGYTLVAVTAAVNSGVTGAAARVAFGMVEEDNAEDCGDACSPSSQ